MLKANIARKIIHIESLFKIKISALSRKSGLGEHALSEILNGSTKDPGVYSVAKIADVLKCSVDELISQEADEHDQKEVRLALAKSCVIAVIDLLRQQESTISLDQFLSVLVEVYVYCLDKNLKTVDIKFATQFVTDATKAIT